jgi:type IV secretory pathway VirB10-like protein
MNEQYLWDKTTEPDDETKELESLLSEFRFQPRPLVLPVAPPKKFFVFDYRIAAIAATVLISFGFLFWLSFRNNSSQQAVNDSKPSPSVASPPSPENQLVKNTPTAPDQPQRIFVKRKPTVLKPIQISHKRNQPSMATQERMAKDKLMFALQITSDKLDFIQHKISVDSN